MSEQNSTANDYALAKHLNDRAITMFTLVNDHLNTPDITAINRSYVLIVNELKRIYNRQPLLDEISEPICWQHFSNLAYIHEEAGGYLDYVNDYGQSHNGEVISACIIAGIDQPSVSPTLQKILSEANLSLIAFTEELEKMYAGLSFDNMTSPVVMIGSKRYRLASMQSIGLAYIIISYCLRNHPNQTINIDTLKHELNKTDNKAHGIDNLRDNIRKSVFGDKKPLSPFIEVSPKSIRVKQNTALNERQIQAIQAASK